MDRWVYSLSYTMPWGGDVFHFLSVSLGRAVLERFDLKKLTSQVGKTLLEILERRFPYVDEFLSGMRK